MPAVPIKDRWWRTKPASNPDDNWCILWANQTPLNAAWHGMESLNDLYRNDAVNWSALAPHDPYVQEKLGSCPICDMWDRSKVTEPINIPLMPTNKKGEVSPHYYRKLWMSHVSGTPVPMMHRKLFDIVSDDFDNDILVGEVYILGGDRIPDLVSVLDRRNTPRRWKYNKQAFKHFGHDSFKPCHHCGRIYPGKKVPDYLLRSEIHSEAPRVLWASLLVSPKTRKKTDFRDNSEWPKMEVTEVPVFDTPADPIPTPYPEYWEELDASLARIGIELPPRRISIHNSENPGPWINARIKEHGKQQCVVPSSSIMFWTMVFYVRYRALFEPKVAERVDHWSDKELFNFVKDSHEFSGGATPYFPV